MKLPAAILLVVLLSTIVLAILAARHEQCQWERYAAENDCRVVERSKYLTRWFCEVTQQEIVR